MNWALLQNSFLVSALAALLAVAFGLAVATGLAGLNARGRRVGIAISLVALALPPFLVTSCWLHLLGFTGVWRSWLPANIYTLGGTVWVLALLFWPIATFAVLGSWQRLQANHLEGDAWLRGGPLIRWLLLPLAKGSLIEAFVLIFVLALGNFAVPAILQTKVFTAEVWVSFNTSYDYLATLQLSWPLMVVPLVILFCFRHREAVWPRLQNPVAGETFRRSLGRGWYVGTALVAGLILVLSVGLPLYLLISAERTWTELPSALLAGQKSILTTFLLSMASATLAVVAGWSLARWRAAATLWLSFLIPGVLLGIALIWLLNRPPLIAFYQSAGVMVLALVLRYAGPAWTGAARAQQSVDTDLMDAARLSVGSRWLQFRHGRLPQMAGLLAGAWYVIYLLCLWDVESLVLISPPGMETLAVRIFNLLHYGHNAQVNALCVLLLGLAVLPLTAWVAGRKIRRLFVVVAALSLATGCVPSPSENSQNLESQVFRSVQLIGSTGTGVGQFNKPRSVAVDGHDNLYVVDMTGRVQKFSSNGVFMASYQMEQTTKGRPKGMCRDRDGNIVVVEPHYSRVNYFTPDLKVIARWGVDGTNAGQLAFPRSAAVNSRGEIYLSEYGKAERVQRFTARGEQFLNTFGKEGEGAGQFNRAEGLCIDNQDLVFVADSCNHRIQVFSPEGKFLRTYGRAGIGPGQLSYPYDICVDAQGFQFVCEFGNSRVQVFDAHDRPVEILGRAGVEPGEFSNPWGVALDSAGNLYVADSRNNRVQKFIRRAGVGRLAKAQ